MPIQYMTKAGNRKTADYAGDISNTNMRQSDKQLKITYRISGL